MHEGMAGKLVIKNSRFFAHLYIIEDATQVDAILSSHRSMYAKANHHCYALRVKTKTNQLIQDSSDDGEVGRPGQILLQILQKHGFESHALVVSRVFGGIKLGVGGVSRAFRQAGEGVVQHYKQR
jgi:putative IMPACT (imprinted ancient) family translation regulator